MARDYKHSARKRRKPPPTPPWVWITSGFIAGLGVALGVHLYHLSNPAETSPEPRAAVPASEAADDEQAQDAAVPEPEDDYSFYEALKETVVRVPDESEDTEPPRPPPTGTPSFPTPGPAPPPVAESRPASPPPASGGSYLVQTGSFRDAREAEAMRASLGLLGLTSTIQRAVDGQDRVWHRVQVPAASDADLARVRSLLEREDIDMMVIAQND